MNRRDGRTALEVEQERRAQGAALVAALNADRARRDADMAAFSRLFESGAAAKYPDPKTPDERQDA